jgi:hypothetical protein
MLSLYCDFSLMIPLQVVSSMIGWQHSMHLPRKHRFAPHTPQHGVAAVSSWRARRDACFSAEVCAQLRSIRAVSSASRGRVRVL